HDRADVGAHLKPPSSRMQWIQTRRRTTRRECGRHAACVWPPTPSHRASRLRCGQPHRSDERASFPAVHRTASVDSYPDTPRKEPEMNARSHSLSSVLKRAAALHHGGKAAAPAAETTPGAHHGHQPNRSHPGAGHGVLLFVLLIAQL